MQSRLPVIEAALKEYNATIIVAETSRGEKYVEAAVFEKEEDLVVFKLIYS